MPINVTVGGVETFLRLQINVKLLTGGTSGEWKFILNLRAFLIDNLNIKLLGNEEDYYF